MAIVFVTWFLFIFVFYSIESGSVKAEDTFSSVELSALNDFYYSTGGPQWSYDSSPDAVVWNFTKASPNPCIEQWYGISCMLETNSNVFHVTGLTLPWNLMKGFLPNSIGNFSYMTSLNVSHNGLSQSIPSSVGMLTKLVNLSLGYNQFSGTLPESLWSLLFVQVLSLSSNNIKGSISSAIDGFPCVSLALNHNLSGSIPDAIGGIIGLQSLALDFNSLTNSIPSTIGNLNELVELTIDFNDINGTLPETMYDLHLQTLSMNLNQISGNLSSRIGQWTSMQFLDLSANHLTGTIPTEFSNLIAMIDVRLNDNAFSGSLPDIGNFELLQTLDLEDNLLSRSLPTSIFALSGLSSVKISSNKFSGTLPDMDQMTSLSTFLAVHNHFNGTIPNVSRNFKLEYFDLSENELTGALPNYLDEISISDFLVAVNYLDHSIPESFCSVDFGNFDISYNQISGTIPNCFAAYGFMKVNNNYLHGTLPDSIYVSGLIGGYNFDYNYLSGTISNDLSKISSYVTMFRFGNNLFSGTIPNALSSFLDLAEVSLEYNRFTGTLPTLSIGVYLETVFLNDNIFTGRLVDSLVLGSDGTQLINFDASNNQFSGPIPAVLFSIESFQTFAAVSNCFTGSLPPEMCDAKNLLTLALDGLRSASSCQNRFFPQSMNINSYWLDGEITGGIPECLFDLPKLRILHLSGNGFSGSVHSSLTIRSTNLTDLSLSNNNLKGTIPAELQHRNFLNLDLSYNKFDGTLQDEFASYESDASLSLEVNRLSGDIPPSLKSMRNISVLDGNIFSCDADRNQIPDHDPESQEYECGSNTFNYSMYTWIGLFGMLNLFGVFMMTMKSGESAGNNNGSWMRPFERRDNKMGCVNVVELGSLLSQYRVLCLCITVFIVVVALPVNSVLSVYFNTYTYEYAWTVTSAYLSGVTPALCLLCLVVVFFCMVVIAIVSLFRLRRRRVLEIDDQTASRSWQQWCAVVGIVLFDMVLMVGMNIAYVYIFTQYDATVVQITQICVSLFKIGWNNVIIRVVLQLDHLFRNHSYGNDEKLVLLNSEMASTVSSFNVGVGMMLFNNLAAPFIATSLVSSNCFYTVITTPPAVQVSYLYSDCTAFTVYATYTVCNTYVFGSQERSTSYIPPFNYSYQCSSTFITTYVSIYVFMLIVIGFIAPAWKLVLLFVMNNTPKASMTHTIAAGLLPKVMKPKEKPVEARSTSIMDRPYKFLDLFDLTFTGHRLFNCEVLVVQLVNLLVVLATFGVVVPAVAVVGVVTVYSATYFAQWCIGRYIQSSGNSGDDSSNLAWLEADCRGAAVLFLKSLWLLVPFVVIFYSFLLFDTLGDEVGWRRAIWLPVSIVSVLFVVWLLRKCRMYTVFGRMTRESRRSWGSDRRSELDEEVATMDEKLLSS